MEEHVATSGTILLNVLIQVANLVVFFLVFKYLLGDKITSSLLEREHLINKLKNAEHEYNKIIDDAKVKGDTMISEVIEKQKVIVKEHELVVDKHKKDILDDAHKKAEDILKNAEFQAHKMHKELEDNWEDSVKQASKIVVKKMI
jgi:vacuolar-type H+-ATPase subunit H